MVFREVADRVWLGRPEPEYPNVTVIAGRDGLVVVDPVPGPATLALIDDIRDQGVGAVVNVVHTHGHDAHTQGTAAVRAQHRDLTVYAHEAAAEHSQADRTFSSAVSLDLGERVVELVHPGRGHTDGDLLVRVPDVDLVVAGDLIEDAGAPGLGPDCYPLQWPWTLDIVLGLSTTSTLLVPGHGAVMDRAAVEAQRNAIGLLAQEIRDLAGRGLPARDAVASGTWPFPDETITHAVHRGYQQLSRHERRLPLT